MSTPDEPALRKKPSQVYFTDDTKRKIKWLAFQMDTSQSGAIAEAVDRLHETVSADMAKQPADSAA